MRILLIWPILDNQAVTSIGVGFIAASAKARGHDVKLIQLNQDLGYPLDLDRIERDVRDYRPGLVGFSVVTNQYPTARRIAAHLKAAPDLAAIPILMGGPHCTIFPEECIADPSTDYVCVGEGEHLLAELGARLEERGDPADIPGLWLRGGGGDGVIKNPVPRPIGDTDEIPFMDLSIFDVERILPARNGWLEVQFTRGCPYECHYCIQHYYKRLYKDVGYRLGRSSVDVFVANIAELAQRYPGIKLFNINDETFTVGKKRVMEFCAKYQRHILEPFGIGFNIQTRPDHWDLDMAKALKTAGCRIVKFGVEAGSERMRRDVLNRPEVDEDLIVRAFQIAHDAKLESWSFNMIGLPTESKDELLQTFRMNARFRPNNFWLSIFFPYHKTPLYELCREMGMIVEEKWMALTNYRTDSCLDQPGYDELEIAKIYKMSNWFLNKEAYPELATTYDPLIERFFARPLSDWKNGTVEQEIAAVNADLMARFESDEQDHYDPSFPHISIKKEYQGAQARLEPAVEVAGSPLSRMPETWAPGAQADVDVRVGTAGADR